MLTQELVKSLFHYKNGFLYWNIKPCYTVEKGSLAGCICIKRGQKRRVIKIKSKPFFASRLIFLFHKGYLPEEIDHEDRNTLNDQIENLREADHLKNMWNLPSRKNSSSKYLGVSYHSYSLWRARIRIEGKEKYLGLFKLETDAALAYNDAAFKYRGEFANLNKIETKKKTMINITIEGENASDVRKQIQELLGLIPAAENSIENEKIAENFATSETQVSEVETPVKKRRTKAEIEAEKASTTVIAGNEPAGTVSNETDIQSDNDVAETQAQDNKEASKAITADMLKEKAVELIRNNKKPEVTALVKSFGADSVATADKNPIKPEDYVRFMDELNKL